MKINIYGLFVLLFCASGCILPIPHKRVCFVGQEGVVCDARTGRSVKDATVNVIYSGKTKTVSTDIHGRYKVSDEKSWHMAYLIGIPVSFSLFPTLDAPSPPHAITISADGYHDWEWHMWFDIDESGNITDATTNNDPAHVELKPKHEASQVFKKGHP